MADALKLRARDGGDLEMIAAILQDALVPLDSMKYLPQEQRFALMLNRFRWEGAPKERVGEAAYLPDGGRSRRGRNPRRRPMPASPTRTPPPSSGCMPLWSSTRC